MRILVVGAGAIGGALAQKGRVHAARDTRPCVQRRSDLAQCCARKDTQHCRDFGDDVVQAGKRICLRRLLSNISAGANRRSTLTCRAILPAV